jgi:hypothetical protein
LLEVLIDVPEGTDEVWVLLWVIEDSPFEIVCCISIEAAKATFAAIAKTRNPAAIIIVASVENSFILMFLMLEYH